MAIAPEETTAATAVKLRGLSNGVIHSAYCPAQRPPWKSTLVTGDAGNQARAAAAARNIVFSEADDQYFTDKRKAAEQDYRRNGHEDNQNDSRNTQTRDYEKYLGSQEVTEARWDPDRAEILSANLTANVEYPLRRDGWRRSMDGGKVDVNRGGVENESKSERALAAPTAG